jgi:hypothetical protein
MKKLFAIIFSFQLILSPVALAEDECSAGQDCYKATGDGSSEGAARYTNSIMMTGSGVVGANMIFCTAKSYTWSHYVFFGGALTLLVSEIIAATKAKEAQEELQKQMERQGIVGTKVGEYQTKEQKDAQLVLLNTAKEQEIKNRDALQERLSWMTAVEVIYWLAVASAGVELILFLINNKPYPNGYNDQSLICNNDGKHKMTIALISAAYGLIPGLASGDVGGAAMKGISAGGFSYMLNSITGKTGSIIQKGVTTALGRIIAFGLFAALAEVARSGLKNSRDRANKNIEVIEKSIEEWKKANTTTTTIAGGDPGDDGQEPNPAGTKPPTVKPLPKPVKTTKCMGSTGSGLDYSSKSCSKPIKLSNIKMDFKSPYLNSMGGKSFEMADNIASGNTDGAKLNAAELGSNAAKVKAEVKAILNQANEKLKAEGQKPIDFDKAVQAQLAGFSKSAQDSLAASGIKGLDSSSSQTNSDAAAKDEKTPEVSAVKGTGAVDIPDPDLSLGTGDMPVEETASAAAGPEQSLNDFETNEQDISKKSDVSLFKQLSNRYILNYTKIFDRKKDVEVVEEPKKK